MPIRGKPERPRSSGDQGITAEGLDAGRETSFGVSAGFVEAPFVSFGVSATFAARSEATFGVSAGFADRKDAFFGVSGGFIDVDGNEVVLDLFGVSAEFGPPAGYPSFPRLSVPNQIDVGQRVRRPGAVIPVAD